MNRGIYTIRIKQLQYLQDITLPLPLLIISKTFLDDLRKQPPVATLTVVLHGNACATD